MSHEDIPTWIGFAILCLSLIAWATKIMLKEREEVLSYRQKTNC